MEFALRSSHLTIGLTAQANGSMNAAALASQDVAFLCLDPTKQGVSMPLFTFSA